MSAQAVEDTLKRIQSSDGVVGIVIMNTAGVHIKSTMENSIAVQYASLLQRLVGISKLTIKKIDPTDDLSFLRLRTKKHEICIISDKQYIMIVIQNLTGPRQLIVY